MWYNIILVTIIFREDSSQLTYLNIQELTNSPSQNGSDTRLAYYVDLPSGGTMPKHILATIFVFKKRDILSQNSSLVTSPLPDARVLTPAQQENLVGLQVLALPINEVWNDIITRVCCWLKLPKPSIYHGYGRILFWLIFFT